MHCVPRVFSAWLKKACARLPWRMVEILPYALACCFMLQYFGNEDGQDYIHTTVWSLQTDQQHGSPLRQMENMSTILYHGITVVVNRKWALLLHLTGPAVQDIFATLSGTRTSYVEALTVLNTYLTPQKSYNSNDTHHVPNESISQYVTPLRWLGEHCDFDKYSLDEAIKDQLIEHCHSNTLHQCLLHEKSTVSLSFLIDIACSRERELCSTL